MARRGTGSRVRGLAWIAGGAVAMCALAWTPVARADATAGQAAFEAGSAAFTRRDFAAAYERYREAFELWRHFKTAAGLGQVELELGKHRDAAEHLALSLALFPSDPSLGDARAKVEQGLRDARRHVGVLRVTAAGTGVELAVDGRPYGADWPEEIFVEPGARRVVARAPDGATAEATVTVARGATESVALEPKASGPAPRPVAPAARADEPHLPADPAPAPSGGTTRTLVLVGGTTLTLAAVGFGVGFHLKGEGAAEDADAARERVRAEHGRNGCAGAAASKTDSCNDLDFAVDQRERANATRNVAFVAAGVLGAATVATYLAWPSGASAARASLRLVPAVAPGAASLSVTGSFE